MDTDKTRRTRVNRTYGLLAWNVLQETDDPSDFDWLCPRDGLWKWGLMTELGRLDDPEWIVEYARVLCDQQPYVKHGERALRRARLHATQEQEPSP